MQSEITFLTKDQVVGLNSLSIFNNDNITSKVTDFSILLGYANVDGNGKYWLQSPSYDDNYNIQIATSVDSKCNIFSDYPQKWNIGVRPCMPLSSIPFANIKENNGVEYVEYGEYPQGVVDEKLNYELNEAFNLGYKSLKSTHEIYTTYDMYYTSNGQLKMENHTVYEYNGEKYIRVMNPSILDDYFENIKLSNGQKCFTNKVYWIKVEPIIWLVDRKENIAISEKILFAGPFDKKSSYSGDFSKTTIKKIIDKYFAREITRGYNVELGQSVLNIEKKKKELETLKKILESNMQENPIQLENIMKTINDAQSKLDDKKAEIEDFVNSYDEDIRNKKNS